MNPKTYFQCQIDNILRGKDPVVKQEFLSWLQDPCYDLENKQLQEFQEMIWYIELKEKDSEELNTYKQTIKFIKRFLSE